VKFAFTLLVLQLLVLPCIAGTGDRGKPPASLFSSIDGSRVDYDEPGDGAVWARAEHYEMSFDAAGATYFPGFGSKQPHIVPHRLSPDAVSVGGEAVAFEGAANAQRSADHVEFDRGALVEAYDLGPKDSGSPRDTCRCIPWPRRSARAASCVFIQGSIAGATYGDGIRCFSGALVRLGLNTPSSGLARYPIGTDPTARLLHERDVERDERRVRRMGAVAIGPVAFVGNRGRGSADS